MVTIADLIIYLFFKSELEHCILSDEYESLYFETVKIPKIDLCVSVPLNIGGLETPEDTDYERWRKEQVIPFTTSFINLFPKNTDSFVIVGYHLKFPCRWIIEFIARIKNGNKQEIFKQLSDLITLRTEFWTMSQSLFKKLDKNDLDRYKKIFRENVYNHSPILNTDLNLFKNI